MLTPAGDAASLAWRFRIGDAAATLALRPGRLFMKAFAIAALLVLSAVPAARAADAVCNIDADVTDTDPKGLNVRDMPGGKVTATLVDNGDWIQVHIVGQSGDWFQIDRANLFDNNRMGEDIVLWRGKGYVHKSTVGTSGLENGAIFYADHDEKSRVIIGHAAGDQTTQLLACWHDFYKIHIKRGTGWTKGACLNENTTCV
jgi:hypothetical protein